MIIFGARNKRVVIHSISSLPFSVIVSLVVVGSFPFGDCACSRLASERVASCHLFSPSYLRTRDSLVSSQSLASGNDDDNDNDDDDVGESRLRSFPSARPSTHLSVTLRGCGCDCGCRIDTLAYVLPALSVARVASCKRNESNTQQQSTREFREKEKEGERTRACH